MKETKSQKKRQITVFLGCVIKNKRVLMIQRNEKGCPGAHLKWELPGGKVNFNETPQESVKKELYEEAGVKVKIGKLLPYVQINYWKYPWGAQQTLILCFTCELLEKHRVKKDHHVEKISWVPLEEIEGLETLPGIKEFIKLASQT